MHIHGSDLMVSIGGVIVDPLIPITAAGIQGHLKVSISQIRTALLLIYGAQDMEELADAFEFGVAGSGVHFCEGNFGKAGGGGKVSREAEGAHTAAVGLEF